MFPIILQSLKGLVEQNEQNEQNNEHVSISDEDFQAQRDDIEELYDEEEEEETDDLSRHVDGGPMSLSDV